MDALRRDLLFAWRLLRRRPGFLAAAVLTLALGIGLNSAVFSLVSAVLLRPLPVASPQGLVSIFSTEPDEPMSHGPTSAADLADLRRETRSLAELIAYTYTPLAVEDGGESRLVLGKRVSRRYFELLGVEPALGRSLGEDKAAGDTAVLAWPAWQRRYGADPGVVGRRLRVNGQPVTVVGVAPRGFFGLTRGFAPEMWLPLDLETSPRRQDRDLRWLWVVGRLAPPGSLASVRAEIAGLAARLREDFPASHRERTFAALPTAQVLFLPDVDGGLRAASAAALAGVALVLLVAAANVAHMLLARSAERRREMATRLALGARPAAILRQLLTESLLLAALGAALGLFLAWGANAALNALRLPVTLDLALDLALDLRVVAFTAAWAALVALVFALAPAAAAARTDLIAALQGAATGGRRRRWTAVFVAAQVALSLVLLLGAALAVRSMAKAHRIDPGFESRGVVVAALGPRLGGSSPAEVEDFYRRLLARVEALPEVATAGLTSHLPLSAEIRFEEIAAADGGGEPAPDAWRRVDAATVSPGYLETLRVPLLSGRTFDDGDGDGAPRVAVVNRALARRWWPGADAVGRRLRVAGAAGVYQVVGVVGEGKYRTLGEAPRPFLYLAFDQGRWARSGRSGEITTGTETLVARVDGEAGPALAVLRRTIRELDDRVAVSRLSTLEQALGPALALPRTAAALFALFGVLALVLAATGIYGVTAYAASRRTRELGIRRALGARRGDVIRLVLRDAMAWTAGGLAAGWAGAFAAGRALEAFLYGVTAGDAVAWGSVSLLLAAVALFAAWIPARRAARVDPWTALRHE
jgi:predicted permease